jgi:hypothetical protein
VHLSSQVQQQELQLKQERAAHEEQLGQVQEEAQQQLRQVQQQLRAEVAEVSTSCAMLEDQVERLAQDKQGGQGCSVLLHVHHSDTQHWCTSAADTQHMLSSMCAWSPACMLPASGATWDMLQVDGVHIQLQC